VIPSNEAEDAKVKYKEAARRSLLTNVAIFLTLFIISSLLQLLHDRSITVISGLLELQHNRALTMFMILSSAKTLFPIATALTNFSNIFSLAKLYIEKMTQEISNFMQRFF
jgi:hypothetical protein